MSKFFSSLVQGNPGSSAENAVQNALASLSGFDRELLLDAVIHAGFDVAAHRHGLTRQDVLRRVVGILVPIAVELYGPIRTDVRKDKPAQPGSDDRPSSVEIKLGGELGFHFDLATFLRDRGRFDDAIDVLIDAADRARETGAVHDEVQFLLKLGGTFRRKANVPGIKVTARATCRYSAKDYLARAYRIAERENFPTLSVRAHLVLARVYIDEVAEGNGSSDANQYADAEDLARDCLARCEAMGWEIETQLCLQVLSDIIRRTM